MSRFVQLTDYDEIFDMWEAGLLYSVDRYSTQIEGPHNFHIRARIKRQGYDSVRKDVLGTWKEGGISANTYGVLVDD